MRAAVIFILTLTNEGETSHLIASNRYQILNMELENTPKKSRECDINEDYIEKTIGAFGVWQAKVCVLASLTRFLAMWNMLNIMFLTYDSSFTCVRFNRSQPGNVTPSTCYENCVKYEFGEGLFLKGFVEEFALICDRAWMTSFAQTILMFGLLFGVSLFGWISDRFGRSKAMFYSAFLVVVFMLGSCFAPDYWTFCGLRFLIGVATGGQMIVAVVLVLEVVGSRHREITGACISLPDGIAEATLVAFAHFAPTWRVYLLSMCTVSALLMVFQILLPESPRWLMSRGQEEKARKILTKAIICNNLSTTAVDEHFKSPIPTESKKKNKATYFNLFNSRKLAVRSLATVSVWIVNGVCFFGINQYCTFLGTNVYLSVVVMGLMQIPACFVATWLNKVFGRKATMISNFGIIGLTMLLLIFTPKDHWSALTLGIIGLWAVNITCNVLYVWVAELFPTPLRNMAYGMGSSGAKVGAMVAPFIANLGPHWMPSLIFSTISFLGVITCYILPETKGKKLEDDLDHANQPN
ncbi:organic cation transporter protein-like [Cydia pomonella]|uniref:organic cation transporter protein-like n=1 Tax=Cydia pomonella TaxID=82600 RepID=UPI002ADDD53D|nr:organic cation transporter protein-like [Cydia pomonella]